jgi:class 3 adenylate cyclase/pimeloyl-ACP methyl ester carboxylesterase
VVPQTRFTEIGDSRIAYQVFGNGPPDLLWIGGWNSHVDAQWELPTWGAWMRRLASFVRVIIFDRRGMGASDPLPGGTAATWEDWMEDVRAVLEAVGSERTIVAGMVDGGPPAMLFAATYPAQTQALIVVNSTARVRWAEDYPFGMREEVVDSMLHMVEKTWGNGAFREVVPSMAADDEFWRLYDRFHRMSCSRRAAVDQLRLTAGMDVRAALPAISVPTLVVHRSDPAILSVEHGRYLAAHIPGARFVKVPGRDLSQVSPEMGPIHDAIEEFVTGVPPAPAIDRVLATVLFTDMVGSTERAAALGDRRWRAVLDEHDAASREEVAVGRGRLVKITGDGVLATFDGPARAIRCAVALTARLRELGIETRCGLHTGEVEDRGDDVGGIGVHIASRVMRAGAPGEVVVSSTVRDLVTGAGIGFNERGIRTLRGVPGRWRLFAVTG